MTCSNTSARRSIKARRRSFQVEPETGCSIMARSRPSTIPLISWRRPSMSLKCRKTLRRPTSARSATASARGSRSPAWTSSIRASMIRRRLSADLWRRPSVALSVSGGHPFTGTAVDDMPCFSFTFDRDATRSENRYAWPRRRVDHPCGPQGGSDNRNRQNTNRIRP